MRLPRITLAAKYRILFGLAVLLIIAAALAVPWLRMDQLVLDLPYREARRIATDFFRFELPHPESAPVSVHAGDAGMLHDQERLAYPPRFYRYTLNTTDPQSPLQGGREDPFVAEAFRTFLLNPAGESTFQLETHDGTRWLHYAQAIRVSKRCLICHDEGKSATPFNENQFAGIVTVQLPADSGNQGILNRIVLVAAGLLAGILAILVFYLLVQKFILAPVHALREVTIRVAEGERDVRADIRTGDEFEQLAHNFNIMLERLRASQAELQKANALLDEKLGQMAESNVALFEANRIKSEFLANVSHELRTPLTSIIGFAELLREGPDSADPLRYKRFTENILISGRILLEIINDLLDLAKIEAGKVELHIEPVRLSEMCATLIDIMRPLADKKSLLLNSVCAANLPVIDSDPGRLRQILYNLLSNAIKFTPAGGSVRLEARRVDDAVEISVSDTGPGIGPEHRELIFEKFRQIDQSATREHHGTGLGLAISKELTLLLGGRIGVESEPGRGARFWVRLPLTAPVNVERPAISLV